MTGYPGYEVEEKEEKGTQLNFSKYDRFEEFQENPGYPYYIDYSDLASSDEGVVHQILSPISNSKSTNFFNEYFISFSSSITQFQFPQFEVLQSGFLFLINELAFLGVF